MVQFSSKPPFPKKVWETDRVYTFVDRPQHNPTNRILTTFRRLHAETGNDLWTDAYLAWSDLIEEDSGARDEYWHAFSVLGKIVATGKVNR